MSLNYDKEKKNEKRKCKSEEKGDVDTSNFSIEERLVSAVWVHERKFDKTSIAQIKINFRKRFGKAAPTKNTLYFWEKKLFSTGKVMDAKRSGRPCRRYHHHYKCPIPSRMKASFRKAHIPSVEASLQQCPGLSLRARAEQLALPRTTLIKILKEDLHIKHINGNAQNQSGKYSSPEIETPPLQTPKQQLHKPEKLLQQKPQQEVQQQHQQHVEIEQQVAITTNNMISCPPPAYPYPDTPTTLPFSALQHYLSYPTNKYHNRQQSQQISQIVNPSVPLHGKLQPDPQNYAATNVGMAPHMLSHPHQHHMHHVNQHNYQTNPQMIFKYEGFHAQ